MRPTQQLHDLGQSIWLDNITRTMLSDGTLRGYIDELSVTGLTSNPTIFDKAISGGDTYDEQIGEAGDAGTVEDLFFDLALTDLRQAADLFAPVHNRTDGVDGWVSMEVSPLLADVSADTIEQAARLHQQADRDNVYIKIPGTEAGCIAIEESIFAGIPINVTLLFSAGQYQAAAEAFMRGLERRIEAGLNPAVPSVASIFISRWDVAVMGKVPEELRGRLGIAVAKRAYRDYRELLDSARWQRLANEGARPQRLLFASTGTKDPEASDVLYIESLIAPLTIDTTPDGTLSAFADHGKVGEPLARDGGDAEDVLAEFGTAGIDVDALAEQLQVEGKDAFSQSWSDLLSTIGSERERLVRR
jgi:transaldolase